MSDRFRLSRMRRLFAVAGAVLLALTVSPLAGTAGAQDGVQPIDPACEGAPDITFNDGPFENEELNDALDCIGADEFGPVAEGRETGNYDPGAPVLRDEMAAFLARELAAAGVALPENPDDAFTDDDGNWAELQINQLAELGVTEGTGEGEYSPKLPVTREQMASFVVRTINTAQDPDLEEPAEDQFPDDCADVHEPDVNTLATTGIVQGTESGNYECGRDVTRGEMALFLARTLGHLAEEGVIFNPFIGAQTYTVTPTESETLPVTDTAVQNNRRAYTASELDPEQLYNVALFPAENVSADGSTFESNALVADNSGPSIETVNGDNQFPAGSGNEAEQVVDVEPNDNGEITFTVDSTVAEELVPVVYLDTETEDDMLDLRDDGRAAEQYGVGGQTNWVPDEAGQGDATGVTVTNVNRDADYFVADGATYNYDDNDTFRAEGTAVDMPTFESVLSVDDVLDVTPYEPDEADSSEFDITTDAIPDISEVEATASDLDGDGSADDVLLTWRDSDQPDVVYDVHRDDDDDDAISGGDTQVATGTNDTRLELIDQPDGTYNYLIDSIGSTTGTTDADGPFASNDVTVPADDTTSPQVAENAATADDNAGLPNAGTGDILLVHFDEAVEVAADATLSVSGDSGGGPSNLENGANSSWSVDGSTVTIEITSEPSGGPLDYPLTIEDVAGISDTGGNEAVIGDFTDTTLEDDGPEIFSDDCEVGDTTCTIEFNEPVTDSAADTGNYTFDAGASAETLDDATLGADERTVTLEFSNGLDGDETIQPDGVDDTDGDTSGQAAYSLF